MQLSSRVVLLLLSFMLVLAGCEKRSVEEPTLIGFDMLSPVANSNVTTLNEQKMKVKYSGETNLSNLYLELNGADITSEFVINNVSDLAVTDMVRLRSALVQGTNTLLAARKKMDINNVAVTDSNGNFILEASQSFTFYFDDEAPRLTVDSVTPLIANGDGSPQAGTSITVLGKIIDASTVKSVSFTFPGGVRNLLSVNSAVLGNNQFNSVTREYRVTLNNYPATAAATSVPHFSYTATDNFKHTRTEQFMATGTPISTTAALQLNDSLTWNIAPFTNAAIVNGVQKVVDLNILNFHRVYNSVSGNLAVAGDIVEDPYVLKAQDKKVYILPRNQCGAGGQYFFANNVPFTHCVLYVEDVKISNPNVDMNFSQRKTGELVNTLQLWMDNLTVQVQVAALQDNAGLYTYLGGWKGTVAWSNFSLESDVLITPDASLLFKASREPFRWKLTDLLRVPGISGNCDICNPLINWVALYEALGGDLFSPENPPPLDPDINCPSFQPGGNSQSDKKDIVAVVECVAEVLVGEQIDTFIADKLTIPSSSSNASETKSLSMVRDYAVYNNNGHFVFDGSSKASTYSNDALGSLFAVQGKYYNNLLPFIQGWPIAIGGQKNVDISFALSANTINQWLLTQHQSGEFMDYSLLQGITGADLGLDSQDIGALDSIDIEITSHEAPKVSFTSVDTSSASLCLGKLCVINNGAEPGAIKLIANNVDIKLDNTTTAVDGVLMANIDLEMYIELGAVNGLPTFVAKANSIRVKVNSKATNTVDPSFASVSNSAIAKFAEDALEKLMVSPAFKANFSQRAAKVISFTNDVPSVGCGANSFGQICTSGNPSIFYNTIFDNDGLADGVFRSDYALSVRYLTIEKAGSYLSVGLDLRYQQNGFITPDQQAENFMTWQITN